MILWQVYTLKGDVSITAYNYRARPEAVILAMLNLHQNSLKNPLDKPLPACYTERVVTNGTSCKRSKSFGVIFLPR